MSETVRCRLSHEEWYPVVTPNPEGTFDASEIDPLVEVPRELYRRWLHARRDLRRAQQELEALPVLVPAERPWMWSAKATHASVNWELAKAAGGLTDESGTFEL